VRYDEYALDLFKPITTTPSKILPVFFFYHAHVQPSGSMARMNPGDVGPKPTPNVDPKGEGLSFLIFFSFLGK
jgi:hypothetical protein